ncbi:MAG: hypothetical protein RL299_1593 [Pseudomonadota bacterium]|jgi:hypothetical protein
MSLLLAFALLGAASAQDVAEQPQEAEITVIAHKLKNWRGDWTLRGDKIVCKVRKSTGDRQIDAVGCEAFVVCLTPRVPQFKAISDSKLERKVKDAQVLEEMKAAIPCIDQERSDRIAALADRRAGS